jgi:SAM-dependent methyltransferase
MKFISDIFYKLFLLICLLSVYVVSEEAEKVFTDIYKNAGWGGVDYSGTGSELDSNREYMAFIEKFIDKKNIKTVLDLGCGDWQFSRYINWSSVKYTGYDVVKHLIDKLNNQFGSPNIRFIHEDITTCDLPTGDLLICRDVLQHLPNNEIQKVISQIHKFKYCIFTHSVDPISLSSDNRNIRMGDCRPLDLSAAPFNLDGYVVMHYPTGGDALKQVFLIENETEEEALYNQISDLYHPTNDDFALVQNYLYNGKRPYLSWLNTFYQEFNNDNLRYDLRARNLCIWKPNYNNFNLKIKKYNESNNNDICIISYCSLNSEFNYQNKQIALMKNLEKINFKGDLLSRAGGWPDTEGGSLKLVHIPYAFKVCMFREAMRLGYKKVIWMDTSVTPLKNFDTLFDALEENGYLLLTLRGFKLRSHSSESQEEENNIDQIAGGIVGINFEHPEGRALFTNWFEATKDMDPALTVRPEQNILAVLAYKMGLMDTLDFFDICSVYSTDVKESHLFQINY